MWAEDASPAVRALRTVWPILAVAAAYYVGARVGLTAALVRDQVTPLWPPTGIALVCLLLFGLRMWPGIALGAFLVNIGIGPSFGAVVAIAAGNTLAPVLACLLLRRADFRADMGRLRDALALVFLGAFTGMSVSASIGTTALVVAGAVETVDFWSTWSVWWTGDAMGVLVVAPILLMLAGLAPGRALSMLQAVELAAILLATGLVAYGVTHADVSGLFLVFPPLIWAALRYQLIGAAPSVAVISIVSIMAAVDASGPFAHDSVFQTMAKLQAFNGVVALTGLILAARTVERNRVRDRLAQVGVDLEQRVHERTAELAATVQRLERSESLLRRSEEKFRRLVAASPDAVLGVDRSGRIVLTYGRTQELFGYAETELVDRPVEALIPVRYQERHEHHRTEFLSDARTRPMGLGLELSAVRKDGSEFPVDIALSPVETEDGPLVLASVRDVTERRRADQAARDLREAEDRRRQALEINDTVVQGLATAVYGLERGATLDAARALNRTIEAARDMMAKLFGSTAALQPGDLVRTGPAAVLESVTSETHLPDAEAQEPSAISVVIADDTPSIRLLLRTILETEGFRVVGEAADGAEAVRLVTEHLPDALVLDLSMPVLDGLEALGRIRRLAPETKVVVLSGYGRDQAGARALEAGASAYLEKGGAMNQLVTLLHDLCPERRGPAQRPAGLAGRESSDVSAVPTQDWEQDLLAMYFHELRNPLTAVLGIAQTLVDRFDQIPSAASAELLDAIVRNARQIERLVEAFSDAGTIGAEQLSLVLEPADLGALVRNTVRDLAHLTREHVVDVDAGEGHIAAVDVLRIRQVITNLVSNAAKFSPPGSIIGLSVRAQDETISVAVRDQGSGIPEDGAARLFGKFVRLGSSMKGVGLGLYVSRGIARAHSGDVVLAQTGPAGSTFVLTVPALRKQPSGP